MASKLTSDFRRCKVSERDASDASFYPLRMTADHRTEMYVKFAKVMLIFQGPATDKRKESVSSLVSKFKYAGRLISDETFKRETGRIFSSENIGNFYSYCRERAKKSCEEGYNLIIIDQSMNNTLQMQYYFYLAQKMQYVVLMYPPLVKDPYKFRKTDTLAVEFKLDTKTFITQESLIKHLFCGWFLHDVDSAELREEAGLYVQDCFENIFEFKQMFSTICKPCEFMLHYDMVNKRQNLAFCAVKLLQGMLDIDTYMSSDTFKPIYGSMSKLYIVGFIISPHMIAARVKLTHGQRKLWEMRDDLDEKSEINVFPSKLLKDCEVNITDEEITLIASKSNRTIITGESIENPTEAIHSQARGRSCHILLGKVKGTDLKNIDYGAVFAVRREKKFLREQSKDFEPYDLDRCLVRRFGKYWLIYLKETLIVNGFFATCCSVENTHHSASK